MATMMKNTSAANHPTAGNAAIAFRSPLILMGSSEV
jgi:hypothetical protein